MNKRGNELDAYTASGREIQRIDRIGHLFLIAWCALLFVAMLAACSLI